MQIWIRIQDFDNQKSGKIYNQKIFIYIIFGSKIEIYLYLGLHKGRQSYRSLHLALQNVNFLHFCGSFWPSWIRIRISNADPDLADQNKCGSGSTTLQKRFQILAEKVILILEARQL